MSEHKRLGMSRRTWGWCKFGSGSAVAVLAIWPVWGSGASLWPAISTGIFTFIFALTEHSIGRIDENEKAAEATRKAKLDDALIQAQRERDEHVRRVIAGILERFRERYFTCVRKSRLDVHQDRVTLFICEEFCENGEPRKQLRIFARAGAYKDSSCTWEVSDNEAKKCRGMAGLIWSRGAILYEEASCQWPEDDNEQRKAQYAASLGLTLAEAEALRVKSVAFTGFTVIVKGKKWGVLLIDSRKLGQIAREKIESEQRKAKAQKELLKQYAAILSSALEGIQT